MRVGGLANGALVAEAAHDVPVAVTAVTRIRLRSALALSSVVLGAIACGSRSELIDTPEQAGAGGHAGGAGGSGNATSIDGCSALTPLDPTLAVEIEPQFIDHDLRLTESSEDGMEVAAVWLRLIIGKANPAVYHAALFPWAAWPKSETVGPAFSTSLFAWASVCVTHGSGSTYALATPTGGVVTKIATGVDPSHAGTGPGLVLDAPGDGPIFIAPRPEGLASYLVGTLDQGRKLSVTVVSSSGQHAGPIAIGCASLEPPLADAVAYGDGWLAAVSTGAPFGQCADPGTMPGRPTRIDVVRIGSDASVSLVTSIDNGDEFITELHATPHTEGLYVVWRDFTIHAARVTQAIVAGPTQVFGPEAWFQVTTMANHLAIARTVTQPTWGLSVSMYDGALTRTAEGFLPSAKPVLGPDSALGSRDGRSLLVSFVQEPFSSTVRIARFDCVD